MDVAPDVVARETSTADADASTVTDAGLDASDASDSNDFADIGDVQIDVPPLQGFPPAVNDAYCRRLQECCLVPAGQWNQNGVGGCATLLDQFGGAFQISSFDNALDSGLVAYDASAAYTCLHEFLSINCGTISAADIAKVRFDCFGAMSGTLGVDAGPCTSDIECQPGTFCRAGNCTAFAGVGQPCSDKEYSTDCTYLGTGNPPLYCAPNGDAASCQNDLPDDAGCTQNPQCQSGACNYPTCVDTVVFSDPGVPSGTCAMFTIADAGAGD